jgi:hypothetical protein
MAIGLMALREALAAAGAAEDKTNKAVDELAATFDAFDHGLADFATALRAVEGEITVLTWIMGLNFVMTAVILWRVFFHGA